jgi:Domain of unknown function (DUF4389)
MAFAGPAPQRRVTVLFRLLLVIPQFIVLYVLTIVAEFAAIIGWFAALFTGRLPAGLAGFLTDWLRWFARVSAYMWLLTDRYPPLTMGDDDYPVRVSLAPGRLNRLAVLFRIILVIPAWLLAGLLGYSAILVGFVTWLIVLITGTMPEPLYRAVAAVMRYVIRLYGYFILLSGTYPGGLFGDPADSDVAAVAAGLPAVPPGAEPGLPGYAQPEGWQPGYAQPGLGEAPLPASWQPGYAQPGPGQPGLGEAPLPASWPADPQAWRLVLDSTAKRLVGLFIAVGAVVFVAYAVFIGIAASHSANSAEVRVDAVNSVSAAHTKLIGQLNALAQQISACQSQPGTLSCVTKLDQQAAVDIGAFGDAVKATPVPSSAAPAAAQLAGATDQVQAAFQQLGAATSVTRYEQIDSGTLGPRVAQFNAAYQNLGRALGAG